MKTALRKKHKKVQKYAKTVEFGIFLRSSRLIRLNGGQRFYRQGGEGTAKAHEKRMNPVLRDPLRALVVLFFFLCLFPYPVI
jgi:hypothetical protein